MKAIANSNPENAIIKAKGIKPTKNNIIPLVIILYVKPLKICKSIWPLIMLAPNLKPKDIFRLTYDINSIPTNKGNKAIGQPDGTKSEKNFRPWF